MSAKKLFTESEKRRLLRLCSKLIKDNSQIWGRRFWQELVKNQEYFDGRSWGSAKNCVRNICVQEPDLFKKYLPNAPGYGKCGALKKTNREIYDSNADEGLNAANVMEWTDEEAKLLLLGMINVQVDSSDMSDQQFWTAIVQCSGLTYRSWLAANNYYFDKLDEGKRKQLLSSKEYEDLESRITMVTGG